MGQTVHAVRRSAVVVVVVLALLAGVTACTTTVTGSGRFTVRPVAEVTTADQLASLLMSPPTGAKAGTSAWARNRTPSVADLAGQTFKDVSAGTETLNGYGIKAIAHVVWTTADGTGADMALLLFADAEKAQGWKSTEVADFTTEGFDEHSLTAGEKTTGFSFDPDDDDVTDTRFHTVNGKVGVLMDYFTQGSYDDADANAWLARQYSRLT